MQQQPERAWILMAKALVPDQYEDEFADGEGSLHFLLTAVLSKLQIAHNSNDRDFLLRAYTFADWCASQQDRYVQNAAGVSFFEHAFDDVPVDEVVPWIRPETYKGHRDLLKEMRPELFPVIERAFSARAGEHDRDIAELRERVTALLAATPNFRN